MIGKTVSMITAKALMLYQFVHIIIAHVAINKLLVCRWIGGYGHAAVPTHFYKILSRCSNSSIMNVSDCPIDNLETLTFLFEHVRSDIPEVSCFVVIRL